jgi:hypothetical protein
MYRERKRKQTKKPQRVSSDPTSITAISETFHDY